MRTSSLRTRLLLAVGALALAAVVAVALAARQGTREEFLRFQELEQHSNTPSTGELARRLANQLDGRCCADGPVREAAAQLSSELALVITTVEKGRLVTSAGAALDGVESLTTHRDGDVLTLDAVQRRSRLLDRVGLKLLLKGAALQLGDGTAGRLYVVPFPSARRDERIAAFFGSLDRRLLAATVVVALAALLLTWTLAQGIVRPLQDLRGAATDLTQGRPARRVVPRGGREVIELGRAFNAMAAELERQQTLRRTLVHDIAHELRTPLTALRCRLETVLDGLSSDPRHAVRDLHEQVLHLGRLVTDLQDVALAEARELRLHIEDIGLYDAVHFAVRAARLDEDGRLRLRLPDGLSVRADAARLKQIVLNLLTNADRHTPPGGTIDVHAWLGETEISVEVRNSDSHLDPAQLARIFDRFYRGDPSRQRGTGGTGLGLAIVKHLVEAQGGRVWAASDDAGVAVGFALPRSSALAAFACARLPGSSPDRNST